MAIAVVVLAATTGSSTKTAFAAAATLNPAHVGAVNSTFANHGDCPTPPAGQEDWFGWHFIMPGNQDFLTLTVTFQSAGTFTANPFPGTTFVADPDDSHAYIWTPTDDKLLSASATSSGNETQFNLSHTCPADDGTEDPSALVEVSKTANTSFTRTHSWTIDKSVDDNELWLYTNGSGDQTVTWSVEATYGGYTDSAHTISGQIDIFNPGTAPVTITSATDSLGAGIGDGTVELTCALTSGGGTVNPAGYSLAGGATLRCTYSEAVSGTPSSGTNTATVVVVGTVPTDQPEPATAPWAFTTPTTEVNDTVTVKDVSDLFGPVTLGSLDADNFTTGQSQTFTYEKLFKWVDYGRAQCGNRVHNNTASIVGDGDVVLDDDSETVTVHVQCFVGETAWAANGTSPGSLRYNTRGNWATYVAYDGIAKQTTLFAGQTLNAGSVSFSALASGSVTVTVTLTGDWTFVPGSNNLMVQAYDAAPSGNPAPGQFANKKTCAASPCSITVTIPGTWTGTNYLGVHVNVERPDPNFGP